ncbi:MAG: hypothetical protein KIS78_31305 [Labilithrix sp.]|nr:hypothetical protein [Labilithrix sp.]
MRSRSTALVVLSGALALGAAGACSRSAKRAAPVASLSTTPRAAAAFASLREAWDARKVERGAAEDFIARYPDDGAVPLAKLYLAFAMMESGQLAAADGVLASLGEMPPGTTRDLATVARARSLRLHGAPQSALDSLRPLVGKVVDEADREVFLEELALSAIAAHTDYEALAYLDAWLRGVGEDDKERVRGKIGQILETLPRAVLEQTYQSMRARGAASGYGADTQKLVAERLARIAVETNDAALARWLVEQSGVSAAQTGGDAGLELGELAASRRGLATVAGRTVGLLLPTRDRDLRDEAADVVRGLSWALGLPRTAAREEGARLVTRDDGVDAAGTRAAMEELAGEGAAVIVAGFDRASADRAVTWSEEGGVAVILLAAPSPSKMPRKAAVVLGERTEREIAMLADALVRHGVKTAALVADASDDEVAAGSLEGRGQGLTLLPPVRCDVPLAQAGKTRFPIDAWWKGGARGWLVSGPSSCARDLLRDLGASLGPPRASTPTAVALTLESGIPHGEAPRGLTVLSASAGIVPVLAATPAEARDEDVRGFMDRFGVRPSYWTAIGHDAGALSRAALAPLPTDTTTDAKAVVQRRAIVQAGLLATRVRLWTSDDRGVDEGRVLPRSLRLVTWTRDKN